MGQYYKAVLQDGAKLPRVIHNSSGYKLMEHSWVGNNMTDAVARALHKRPQYVAWMGDYAPDILHHEHPDKFDGLREVVNRWHRYAWGEEGLNETSLGEGVVFKLEGKYLVNHTLGEYLDLSRYIESSTTVESNGQKWCVHPLPLLTAVGNGMGGGDYYEEYPCIESVGQWAFDLISLEDEKPEGMTPLLLTFKEEA